VGGVSVFVGSLLPWMTATVGHETLARNGFQLGDNVDLSSSGYWVRSTGCSSAGWASASSSVLGMPRYLRDWAIIAGIVAGVVSLWLNASVMDFISSLKDDHIHAAEGPASAVILRGCLLAVVGGLRLRSARNATLRNPWASAPNPPRS